MPFKLKEEEGQIVSSGDRLAILSIPTVRVEGPEV